MVTITIKDRELIDGIIGQCRECYVGMIDTKGYPYVLPMNFGYKDNVIYLHSAPEGTSIRSLEMNPNVCVTFCTGTEVVHQNEEVACSYGARSSSVICRGKVVFIESYDEKIKAMNIFMENYTHMSFKYSEPSIRNVKVWRIEIENITGKLFGVPYKESHKYRQ